MADVNVTFSAVDEGYSAEIDKMRAEARSVGVGTPGVVTGGGAATLMFGSASPEQKAAALRQWREEQDKFSTSAKNGAKAQEEFGQASQRAGINFGRMAERMVVSLVVFGAIREAMRGIKAAMDEAISDETVTTRFRNLTTNAASANTELAKMAEIATRLGAKKEDLVGLNLALQEGGASAHDAGIETETLAEYAGVTGEKMGPLGEMMTRLNVGAGTISDMEHLVGLMGEAGNPLREQIVLYQTAEVQLRRNEEQISRNTQLQERGIEQQVRLEERAYELEQKRAEAVTGFSDKLGIAKEVFEGMQRGEQHQYVVRAGVNVSDQAEFIQKREEVGERQIEQEEQLSFSQVRRLEQAGFFNDKDLLAAAQRRTEAEREAQKQGEEDARTATRNTGEDAAYQRRHGQEQKLLELQGQVYKAVQNRVGLEANLTKLQETIANQQATVVEQGKKIADNSRLIQDATKEWTNTLGQAVQLLGGISLMYDKIKTQGAPSALTELFAGKEVAQAIFPEKRTAIGIANLFGQTGTEAQFLTPDAQRALQLLERSATANEGIHAALTAP